MSVDRQEFAAEEPRSRRTRFMCDKAVQVPEQEELPPETLQKVVRFSYASFRENQQKETLPNDKENLQIQECPQPEVNKVHNMTAGDVLEVPQNQDPKDIINLPAQDLEIQTDNNKSPILQSRGLRRGFGSFRENQQKQNLPFGTGVRIVLEVPQRQTPKDITDLSRQILEALSIDGKRTADYESPILQPRRPRCGFASFRENQRKETLPDDTGVRIVFEVPQRQAPKDITDLPKQILEALSIDGKRTADYESPILQPKRLRFSYDSFRENQQKETLSDDTAGKSPEETQGPSQVRKDSSETPLGGSERSEASLGDSDICTDSQTFISCTSWTQKQEEPEDITELPDLPTENIEILSHDRKRTADYESPPKRLRFSYDSLRKNQQKEPLPDDTTGKSPEEIPGPSQVRKDSLETPSGSSERYKVSLGGSDSFTESQNFMRYHWGIEGTMMKIMSHIKAGRRPVTVETLVESGPIIVGRKRIVAAYCFSSILKLKEHGFIRITKDPKTLSIMDICLGPKFES